MTLRSVPRWVWHVAAGVALLGAGVAVTVLSRRVVWWGAMAVGAFEILRGLWLLVRRPR